MTENLQLVMSLGCLQMGMTPVEAIRAVTIHGARALDVHPDRGSLETGKRGDVIVLDIPSYHHWLYHLGVNPVSQVWIAGEQVYSAD